MQPPDFTSLRPLVDEPPKRAAVSSSAGAQASFVAVQGVDFYAEVCLEQVVFNPYTGRTLNAILPFRADLLTAAVSSNAHTTGVDVTVEDVTGKPGWVSLYIDSLSMSRLCGDYQFTIHGLHEDGRQAGMRFEVTRGTLTVLPAPTH